MAAIQYFSPENETPLVSITFKYKAIFHAHNNIICNINNIWPNTKQALAVAQMHYAKV